jgi:transcriptional regulator with XRE-family HTH domain
MAKDFIEENILEPTKKNAEFPEMVEAALKARRLLRSLAKRRRELGLSQTAVAARMRTSQSALARLEGGEADPRISTVERYALAMGEELEHRKVATHSASRKTRASPHPAKSSRKGSGG